MTSIPFWPVLDNTAEHSRTQENPEGLGKPGRHQKNSARQLSYAAGQLYSMPPTHLDV